MATFKLGDIGKAAVILTFHSLPFRGENGGIKTLHANWRVNAGEIDTKIDEVKSNSGVWCKDFHGNSHFSPWPCACVEVSNVTKFE